MCKFHLVSELPLVICTYEFAPSEQLIKFIVKEKCAMMKKMRDMKELQKKKGKKGFSMIELIIVIAIMAILIALIGTQLIPYLEKSRQNKDLATLDTCLTNFQAALANSEIVLSGDVQYSGGIDGSSGLPTTPKNVRGEYQSVAGEAFDTNTELNAVFKSKAAGTGDVEFGVKDGLPYVKKGTLRVDAKQGGVNSN